MEQIDWLVIARLIDGAKIALSNFISFKRLPGLIAFFAAASVFCARDMQFLRRHTAPAVSMLIKINPHSIKPESRAREKERERSSGSAGHQFRVTPEQAEQEREDESPRRM